MDMTYEDRVIFGVQNFCRLRKSLYETRCNVNFSAAGNKVSINGDVTNVLRMCDWFVSSSNILIQVEYWLTKETDYEILRHWFVFAGQQFEQIWGVCFSHRRVNGRLITFIFSTYCRNELNLGKVINLFLDYLKKFQMGEIVPAFTCKMQIPANRRDLTGRANAHIESIQKSTETKIEMVRFEEFPQYPFENVVISSQDIEKVFQARNELFKVFTFDLKFRVFIENTRPLLDYLFKKSSTLDRSISISIEPSNESPNVKVLCVSGNEKHIKELFHLRGELIEEVKKYSGFVMTNP